MRCTEKRRPCSGNFGADVQWDRRDRGFGFDRCVYAVAGKKRSWLFKRVDSDDDIVNDYRPAGNRTTLETWKISLRSVSRGKRLVENVRRSRGCRIVVTAKYDAYLCTKGIYTKFTAIHGSHKSNRKRSVCRTSGRTRELTTFVVVCSACNYILQWITRVFNRSAERLFGLYEFTSFMSWSEIISKNHSKR